MNILAIDFGTKNIGLAWCDTGIGAPLPFGIAKNLNDVVKVVKDERIDKIIIGMPTGIDGKENTNTERVKKFAEELKSAVNVPIDYFDERFSSQAADRLEGGVSRDEKSAMIILEGWTSKNK